MRGDCVKGTHDPGMDTYDPKKKIDVALLRTLEGLAKALDQKESQIVMHLSVAVAQLAATSATLAALKELERLKT